MATFSGQTVPKGADPLAMAYAGHQFGGWSPQLGDGRALLLGEVVGKDGKRYDLHLKGSGRTPYSRGGDGKSAIGPVIREYIVSEAMAALGVPTTRALMAIATGEQVYRDQGPVPGGIFTRVAKSHVRVGTFQYFASKGDIEALQTLADYVIDRHYPEAKESENAIRDLYAGIVERQAKLIARWLKFGFIHGVMNTDNMQIAGETIDFGPCAFMDRFSQGKVFSSIDRGGRYAWGRQPEMAHWNLARLGEALVPIWGLEQSAAIEELNEVLGDFSAQVNNHIVQAFSDKLGLPLPKDEGAFIQSTLATMEAQKVDFTLFFSHLRRIERGEHESSFANLFEDEAAVEAWLSDWRTQLKETGVSSAESQAKMNAANPIYIPRNHRVQEAIVAGEQGDYSLMHKLNEVLEHPFEEQQGSEEFELAPLPDEVVHQTFCGT